MLMNKRMTILVWVFLLLVGMSRLINAQSITITSPTAATIWKHGEWVRITWDHLGNMDASVKIVLFDSSNNRVSIVERTPNTGRFDWLVSNSVPEGPYFIRVRTCDSQVRDESETFTISRPGRSLVGMEIEVVEPFRNTDWCKGFRHDIIWKLAPSVTITLWQGSLKVLDVAHGNFPDKRFTWTPPDTLPDGAYILQIVDTVRQHLGPQHTAQRSFQLKTCGDTSGAMERLKTLLSELGPLPWKRIQGKMKMPPPCLACPVEIDLSRLEALVQRAYFKDEQLTVSLLHQRERIAILTLLQNGRLHPVKPRLTGLSTSQSQALQNGRDLFMVFHRRPDGGLVHTQAVQLLEQR